MGDEIISTGNVGDNNSLSVLDRAEKAVKEINEGIAKLEKLKSENENTLAKIQLSGRSEAGFTPQPPQPMSDVEFSKKFMNGEINPFG